MYESFRLADWKVKIERVIYGLKLSIPVWLSWIKMSSNDLFLKSTPVHILMSFSTFDFMQEEWNSMRKLGIRAPHISIFYLCLLAWINAMQVHNIKKNNDNIT